MAKPALMSVDEEIDLVDDRNTVIGVTSRRIMRRENLLHRGVGILCRNSHGQVYVHKRTDTKDLFPGLYDMFVGGVVSHGESYDEAARREIAEELGITSGDVRRLFTHRYEGDRNRAFIAVYDVTHDGSIVHQPEEIAWGGWVAEADLEAWAREVEVVPDGLSVFARWLAWKRDGGTPETDVSA